MERLGGNARGNAAVTRVTAPDKRQPVDVEDLVRWAYGKERVGNCDQGPIAELRHLAADFGDSGCGMGQVERYVSLGAMIAPLSRGSIELIHDDAGQVAEWVGMLGQVERDLVKRHGANMSRPDPAGPGPSRWGPQFMDDPRSGARVVRVIKWDENRNEVYPYCPLRWIDTAAEVEAARGRYQLWHEGLARVAALALANPWRLSAWRVTGFAAPKPDSYSI